MKFLPNPANGTSENEVPAQSRQQNFREWSSCPITTTELPRMKFLPNHRDTSWWHFPCMVGESTFGGLRVLPLRRSGGGCCSFCTVVVVVIFSLESLLFSVFEDGLLGWLVDVGGAAEGTASMFGSSWGSMGSIILVPSCSWPGIRSGWCFSFLLSVAAGGLML